MTMKRMKATVHDTVPRDVSAAHPALRKTHHVVTPSNARVIRVLCVDDHPLVVDGLRAQFAIDGRVEVVGQLSSAANLIADVQRLQPDAVLLDIEMPGPDAFEITDRLRSLFPKVRIIILSAYARDSFVTAAFSSGACAYFTKSDDVAEIIEGVRLVVESPPGAFLLGPTLKQRFAVPNKRDLRAKRHAPSTVDDPSDPLPEHVSSPLDALTPRELEVLRLIGKGLGRSAIAQQLSRSVKTIDGHQERLLHKLKLGGRAELMRFAIREGLAQA